jgi:hypothetical protein
MHTMNEAGLWPDVIALVYTSLPNPAMPCYAKLVVHTIEARTAPLTVKPASSHSVRCLAGRWALPHQKLRPLVSDSLTLNVKR